MIKSERGVFEADGTLGEIGTDLGVAIIGYRGVLIKNGVPLEDANSIIKKGCENALAFRTEEVNE